MKSGIYLGLDENTYHNDDAISSHGLNAIARSPLHFWSLYKNPDRFKPKETPAYKTGTAIHRAVLEPDKFTNEYVQQPEVTDYKGVLDKLDDYKAAAKDLGVAVSGTKAELKARIKQAVIASGSVIGGFWDEIEAQVVGNRIPLNKSEFQACRAISSRIHKHKIGSALFSDGDAESSIFWTDQETGVDCRGRIDWLKHDSMENRWIITDIKSTTNASPLSFQRDVFKYGYHIQSAFYWDALLQLDMQPSSFVFAVWEKKQPYASAFYYLTPELLELGRKEYKRLIRIYAECLNKNSWPGYEDIQPISIPDWYKEGIEIEVEQDDWLGEL